MYLMRGMHVTSSPPSKIVREVSRHGQAGGCGGVGVSAWHGKAVGWQVQTMFLQQWNWETGRQEQCPVPVMFIDR